MMNQTPSKSCKSCKSCLILQILLTLSLISITASVRADITQVTTAQGITVNFTLPELVQEDVAFDGNAYQHVQYDNCGFTAEPGYPQVPVTRVMLGVPLDVDITVDNIAASPSRTVTPVRLPPVPIHGPIHRQPHETGTESVLSRATTWPTTVNQREPYPAPPLARIVQEGMLRSQRVVVLELTPVQYLPQARQLRTYAWLTVHLRFQQTVSTVARPPVPRYASGSKNQENQEIDNVDFGLRKETSSYQPTYPNALRTTEESPVYEQALSRQLLNAEAARQFRAPRMQRPAAPAGFAPASVINPANLENLENPASVRYKLSVEENGVYRLTGESLSRDFGIELIGADPGTFRLWHSTREVPLFISGASDGRFDAADALFFLGKKTDNPYTRWNVYWLSVDIPGLPARVPLLNASPGDATATQVPTFRSTVTFEEDKLTSNLEFLKPHAVTGGDKHAWFEALDFWYWDGIKNGSDTGEMRLEFPLYDVAKSFEPPFISVDLQGGTPVNHEILVAINGVRIDFAKWAQQDTLTVQRTLRAWDTFKDAAAGASNVLSLARVDDTFEEDTRRYPYHVYVNRFAVEYTRLFRAVYDELTFSSKGVSDEKEPRTGRKLQYKIHDFRNPNVHIFETDGMQLVAKMGGIAVEATPVTPLTRQRWKHLHNQENVEIDNVDFGLRRETFNHHPPSPNALRQDKKYAATFQVPDTRQSQFIAISEDALRLPTRIETVQPSELLSAVNGADYLVIAHPVFIQSAHRLADWRAGPKGGSYRTKVVTTDAIYNTFGDGSVHPQAIKAFLTHAYHHWTPPAPTYVVLFGDGTFDFRGIDTEVHPEPPELTGYIPTHYIHTDAFGRTSSDHWYATLSGYDEFTDVYIGRLSVETTAEANAVVDKIVAYEQRLPNGAWRRRIISVADDEVSNSGDFIFKKSLDEIAKNHTLLGYETVEVFLEDVIDEVEARPAEFPNLLPQRVAKNRIIDALGEGAIIAQYAGHGGRVVWAHEAIFDNASIDRLDETSHTPFMLVLSCYNGYFDEPGEPSMAEKLLRKERGGIIGMLSATRLTYAGGNDALNRIIFDMIFKRNVRRLGPLSFDSKVELLLTEGTGQIDVMMEYMLFGDPALQIATPAYEIRPQIQTKTVAPGDTLRIAPGYVESVQYDAAHQTKRWTRHPAFDGPLTVKALFPGKMAVGQGVAGPVEYYTGDVIVTQTLQVTGGAFPGVNLAVPRNIASGDAHVEYYAESTETLAVGGDAFTVNVPKILDIVPELVGEDTWTLAVQVSDDNQQLAAVTLEWRNPQTRQWEVVSLVPRATEIGWWTLPSPLPAPTDGSVIRYEITVTDTDDTSVRTDILRYYPYVYPNLSVVKAAGEYVVRYGYNDANQENIENDNVHFGLRREPLNLANLENLENPASERLANNKKWFLAADVQCEGAPPSEPVTVAFFRGTPDKDEDEVVDADATPLGIVRIPPTAWVSHNPLNVISDNVNDRLPRDTLHPANLENLENPAQVYEADVLNTHPIATATLAHELPFGTHDIFVVVDSTAIVQENDEEDNIGYRRMPVDIGLIGAQSTQIRSLDGHSALTAPPNALATPTVMAMRPLSLHPANPAPNPANLENLVNPAPLPGKGTLAYDMVMPTSLWEDEPVARGPVPRDATEIEQLNQFAIPITIDLSLDTAELRRNLTQELFGNANVEIDNVDFGLRQEALLNQPPSPNALRTTEIVSEAVASRARETGVYLWHEQLGKWTRLASVPLTDASGTLIERMQVTDVSEANHGEGGVRDVRIQEEGARMGKWILFFTAPRTYRLLLAPLEGEPSEDESTSSLRLLPAEAVAASRPLTPFNPAYPAWTDGLFLHIEPDSEKPFAFGDTLTFRITRLEDTPDSAPSPNFRWYASSFRNSNEGSGTISSIQLDTKKAVINPANLANLENPAPERLANNKKMPADRWVLFFVSDSEFQIEGEKHGLLRGEDGTPLRGTSGNPFQYAPYGLKLTLTEGKRPFTAGDTFRFETRGVATIRATTRFLGPVTLMHSADTVPPDIQLTVNSQQHFVTGDATDTAPRIGATLTDESGVDFLTRPVTLELGDATGAYEPIATDAYQLAHVPGSNQVVLTYASPELQPGAYAMRLTASDVHGNTADARIDFHVYGTVSLVSFMNYPNPFARETTFCCELTAPADELEVKIYTLSGRLIRTLETLPTAGFFMLDWDGRDAHGMEVANGVYFAKIRIQREGEKDITEILKMMKLK